jgi:hypothetical protein
MASSNHTLAIRSVLLLCLLTASLAAQWNPTRFDAPYAFTSNNSDSMIEVLNFSGNSPAEVRAPAPAPGPAGPDRAVGDVDRLRVQRGGHDPAQT